MGGPATVAAPIRAAVTAAGWAPTGPHPPTIPSDASAAALDAALASYGQDMVGALGVEVDRIEASIRSFMPAIRHIDLEADRGRGMVPPPPMPPPEASDARPVDINSLSDPAYVFNVAAAEREVKGGKGDVGGWAGSGGAVPPPPPPPPKKGV